MGAHRKNRERLVWAVAALATLAATAFAVGFLRRAPAPAEVVRFQVPQPAKLPVVDSPKLSPDGRYLAFNATDEQGTTRVWVRAMNALEAQPLPGTEGTTRPFWSPDSRFLGFFADGKLKKVEVTGGPPQTICDAPTGADGTWGEDGSILYDGRDTDPIMKVAASGGVPVPIIEKGAGTGLQVGWPQFCLSPDATWEKVSGSGRVVSWMTYHRQYLPAYPAPATIVAAELEEGPILITNIDHAETARLAIDRPIRIIYGDHPDGYRIARFTLAEDAAM